jgi:pantothenate kinase
MLYCNQILLLMTAFSLFIAITETVFLRILVPRWIQRRKDKKAHAASKHHKTAKLYGGHHHVVQK